MFSDKGTAMTTKKPKPAEKAPPSATPEMIEAAFAVLHLQGWHPGHTSPWSALPTPVLRKNVKAPTRAQVCAAREFALQMGWTPLNDQEKSLILMLRRTTYKGRNIVSDLAHTVSRTYPWRDGSPYNTVE